MKYKFFVHNDTVASIDQAVVSLYSIEFTYGFGVYESIRVSKRVPRFLDAHIERLHTSAQAIGLDHRFTHRRVTEMVSKLIDSIEDDTYNLKVLLIGGVKPEDADLYILPMSPAFPDRKLYKTGAHAVTVEYERYLPHAKSLNMLPSYLAYRDAKKAGAYDALLVNRHGEITEGTRTNFFKIDGREITTPPLEDVLEGVTRQNVLKVARKNGFSVVEQPILLSSIATEDTASYFITSTSTKIMPLKSIDKVELPIGEGLKELMHQFDDFIRQPS